MSAMLDTTDLGGKVSHVPDRNRKTILNTIKVSLFDGLTGSLST